MRRVRRQFPRPVARLFADRGSGGSASRLARSLTCVMLAFVAVVASATFGASAASAGVLDVTLAGPGTGTVTSSPSGIDCSNVPGSTQTACSHDYGFLLNTGTLTATPGEGSAFVSWSGTGGGTCTGATNPCVTGILLLSMSVTATFGPKPDPPAVTVGVPSDVEFPSARVNGTVNPGTDDFAVSECYFEYGLTTDYGEKAVCNPKSIGAGTSPVAVSASIGVLDSNKTYHYRLVAKNGGGTRFGEDQTFISGAAPADDCPNAEIRAQQGGLAQRLPNCGAYELVSPPFTAGQSASASVGTADGNQAMLTSVGGFAGTENLPDLGMQYSITRTDSGWKTSAIAPPASEFPFIGTYAALDWTRDGSRSLWFVNVKADEGTGRFTPIVRDPDGSFHAAGPVQEDVGTGEPVLPVATSEDLLTVVQRTFTRALLTDGTTDSRTSSQRSVYVSTRGPDGQLSVRQVAYRAGATMFPSCGVEIGGVSSVGGSFAAQNAVSSDGSRIIFTSDGLGGCGAPAVRRVWAKIGDEDPIDLSASQCPETCGPEQTATFRGASRDGSRVYFVTEQRLLPEDQDTSNQSDLYEYDFNAVGQELRLVTGGSDPAGAGVGPYDLLRASSDGAYVYFVATGRALTGANARGVSPLPGQNNLYVYHRAADQASGATTFIGALGSSYGLNPQVSSTGRFLLIQTTADLTGERVAGDGHDDIYRYDAQDDELLRVWTNDPAHNGAARVAGASASTGEGATTRVPSGGMQRYAGWSPGLQVSDNGSMVGFTTKEPLSPDDRNAATDAYLWQADTGRMTMLTDGTSKPSNQFNGSSFSGMTPSGDSMFVKSATPLLKGHTSGQNAAYVIRRNGGFPGQALPPEPCTGEACQGSPITPPAVPPVGSVDFSGPGNAPATSVSVSKLKAVVGSAAKLKVRVPAAGRVSVTGASVRKTDKSAGKAQVVTVRVALSAKAKRTLRKRKRLSVRVRVAFESRAGGSASKTVTVVFKQPKAKKKGGR
jgi:hypothetical protein